MGQRRQPARARERLVPPERRKDDRGGAQAARGGGAHQPERRGGGAAKAPLAQVPQVWQRHERRDDLGDRDREVSFLRRSLLRPRGAGAAPREAGTGGPGVLPPSEGLRELNRRPGISAPRAFFPFRRRGGSSPRMRPIPPPPGPSRSSRSARGIRARAARARGRTRVT